MIELAALFVAAGVTAALAWVAARPMYEAPLLQRTNHRGIEVPVAAGVVAVAAVIAVEAVLRLLEIDHRHVEPLEPAARSATLLLATGFGLLGAFDDIAAHGDDRGFAGHVRAMARGRLSTGGLKLLGGGLLAIVVTAGVAATVGDALLGAAVVALAANLGNLFDRAPGRTTKVALLAGAVLVAATPAAERPALAGVALVVGAGAGLLRADLREQLMLGDAGANVLGAALGLGLVLTVGRTGEAVALVVLAALNLASEKVSFSKVIASVAPLRALDRLGRSS